ncbi:hypothetical protein PIB30_066025 [Stylosanthes scabra]|uniref:Uncharacterized protein n=1 Tax=Stylosanthes scabra TaxID=79078 RepID=A0ABU6ZKX8_9FABA|nr:hypothetical protein [Stylosanthes scabra]
MWVSLEALAMAGASDAGECAIDIEEWERRDLEEYPLPHLLAEEEDEEDREGEERFTKENDDESEDCGVKFSNNNQEKLDEMKMEMRGPKFTSSISMVKIALATILCMILWGKKKEEIRIVAANSSGLKVETVVVSQSHWWLDSGGSLVGAHPSRGGAIKR